MTQQREGLIMAESVARLVVSFLGGEPAAPSPKAAESSGLLESNSKDQLITLVCIRGGGENHFLFTEQPGSPQGSTGALPLVPL